MTKTITILSLYISLCFTYHTEAQTIEKQFQEILDAAYKNHPDAIGIAFHVVSVDKNISWSGAAGVSKKGTTLELQENQPVLIASNTKTYVATAILRLVEMNKLQLAQPLREVLSKDTCKKLKTAGYDIDLITIAHLLSHTSGIIDYVDDNYFDFIDKNKEYLWTRDKQMRLAMMKVDDIKNPETNYVLLTEIIEQITGQSFYTAMRSLLKFDFLGIENTWFVTLEDTPANTLKFASQYWNKKNWESSTIHPSWDLYGGGGLAATVKDMAVFYNLLFNGAIITNKKIIQLMQTPPFPEIPSNYCLGVQKIDFHGYEAYYHGGFWGTDVMYLPKFNTTIAGYVLEKENRTLNARISQEIIKVLKK